MSIENSLSSIAQSLAKIAEHLTADKQGPVTMAAQGGLLPVAAPVIAPAETVRGDAPFADHAALMTFVMDNYKALGPIKGAKIQDVLTSVGVKNINEVKPEHYAAIKAGVEALKG